MKAVLVKEGLAAALDGEDKLPTTMKAEEKKKLLDKAYSSLILGLGDKVLREVKNETTTFEKETTTSGIWAKLDTLYMSYENFVDTLKYGRQTIKFQEIEVAIIAKDKENRSNGKTDAEGLMVRGKA
ncbi:hypothetical protein JRO89_XS02G0146800 [Xanthoceras sorbifolium]|uniref:Uncharacterized protein n=1 Tax=Xanthoceras sorbifolium TaxID=99658 RepID=A0ABQ8IHB6_9ROSI|nr:hypothetical protein JRO89_XS02G0146800 [Xanthoceras sorbifolium]